MVDVLPLANRVEKLLLLVLGTRRHGRELAGARSLPAAGSPDLHAKNNKKPTCFSNYG
ncbi:hypothetical protein [Rhizobium sp. 12,4]|uniref:hypothetical protein n=1 Tax=Rhizobium sp. 12,4 TaxID=3405135 RepID=UPI003D32FD4E